MASFWIKTKGNTILGNRLVSTMGRMGSSSGMSSVVMGTEGWFNSSIRFPFYVQSPNPLGFLIFFGVIPKRQ
jgi:hypothetical protein